MRVDNRMPYKFLDSFSRVKGILNSPLECEEKDSIPSRDSSLNFENGVYVKCAAIFVDIRNSSGLTTKFATTKTLAKVYKSYISEVVAIMNEYSACREVNIVGDCVSGIFNNQSREDTKQLLSIAAQIHSLIGVINYELEKKGYDTIEIGVGISKGKALMVKAGYKRSGINDIIWMGDVVNHASNLCGMANKNGISSIAISRKVFEELKGFKLYGGNDYQSAFVLSSSKDFYHGSLFNVEMNNWLNEQKEKREIILR